MKKFNIILNNISNFKKRAIITFFDSFLILVSIYISLLLRYESTNIYLSDNIYLFLIGFLLFFSLSYLIKINLQTIRFFNLSNIIFLSKVVFFYLLFFVLHFFNFPIVQDRYLYLLAQFSFYYLLFRDYFQVFDFRK